MSLFVLLKITWIIPLQEAWGFPRWEGQGIFLDVALNFSLDLASVGNPISTNRQSCRFEMETL